ncbi:MAG: two-component regulator propeller domain-containing protein [Candidatus Poribacteria bacterium]
MLKGHWEFYDATDGINGNVYAIQQDREGNLWFATSHCGVTRYDGNSFINFTAKDGLANDLVRALLEDSNVNPWFGALGGGAQSCL